MCRRHPVSGYDKSRNVTEYAALEVFRLLTRQMPKRVIVFQLCSLAFMACSIMALFYWRSLPWAIAAFLTSFLSTMSWVLLRQKCINAWKVSNNPQIVYWANSREFSGALSRRLAFYGMRNYKILTLHLRDGHQSEFHLPSDDVRKFTDWLSERNPSVKWDAYYNLDPTT